jgi:predicted RNase H-like HicB family nuclease
MDLDARTQSRFPNKRGRMKCAVLFAQTETGFSAHAPDLPGCIAAGSTLAETTESIRRAIPLHVAGMRQDGDAIPEPRTWAEYIVAA